MNILADTNIWCDHFRSSNHTLVGLLEYDFLLTHQVVIGELSVGHLPKREQTLRDLQNLPTLPTPSFEETLHLVQERKLWGKGVQWNDFQLLASVILAGDCLLFTGDQRLATLARELGVGYRP